MRCASGCGRAAEVIASRQHDGLILPLCWEHGRRAAAGQARVRPLRSHQIRTVRRRGA